MTVLIQLKCPICCLNSFGDGFVEREPFNFADLGLVIFRKCQGKKGFPEIERIPLVDYLNTDLGKNALKKIRHDTLGLIHALQKYNFVNENDFEFNVSGVRVRINKLKSALLDANGEIQSLENLRDKLKSALLDANGEIQRLKNKVNRVAENKKQISDALLDANGEIEESEIEIKRLRNIVIQYENSALG